MRQDENVRKMSSGTCLGLVFLGCLMVLISEAEERTRFALF